MTNTPPQIPMADMVELLESLVSQLLAQAELRDAVTKIEQLTAVAPASDLGTALDAYKEGVAEGYRKAAKEVDRARALLQLLIDKVETRGEVAS